MSDHKRKSRPIAPAEVRVGDGWIEVVVPDVLGKNEAHVMTTIGEGTKKRAARATSTATKRYRESVSDGIIRFRAGEPSLQVREWTLAMSGAWRVEVLGVWPEERHTMGFKPCPKGDADAAIAQALDALQHGRILDDDARVVEVRAWNLYRKDVRCTVIRLVRVDDLAERDAQIAHLVDRVPASPEPAAKPVPKQRRLRGLTKPRKETPCTTMTSSS